MLMVSTIIEKYKKSNIILNNKISKKAMAYITPITKRLRSSNRTTTTVTTTTTASKNKSKKVHSVVTHVSTVLSFFYDDIIQFLNSISQLLLIK